MHVSRDRSRRDRRLPACRALPLWAAEEAQEQDGFWRQGLDLGNGLAGVPDSDGLIHMFRAGYNDDRAFDTAEWQRSGELRGPIEARSPVAWPSPLYSYAVDGTEVC